MPTASSSDVGNSNDISRDCTKRQSTSVARLAAFTGSKQTGEGRGPQPTVNGQWRQPLSQHQPRVARKVAVKTDNPLVGSAYTGTPAATASA